MIQQADELVGRELTDLSLGPFDPGNFLPGILLQELTDVYDAANALLAAVAVDALERRSQSHAPLDHRARRYRAWVLSAPWVFRSPVSG